MRIKAFNRDNGNLFEFDLYEQFYEMVGREIPREKIKENTVFLRYAGQLCGLDIFEGDIVETSDGHLRKEVTWIDRDYGFGSLYHIARYVEKTGCTINVVDHIFKGKEVQS